MLLQSFDDLHKLWYVLYKERNLLLTIREKNRRLSSPMTRPDENRYIRVKRSMGAIKFVLNERKKIDALINSKEEHQKVSVSSLDIDSQSNKT